MSLTALTTRLAIGRAAHNDLVIDHPGVSAEHAVIVIDSGDGGDAYLEDLGSTNGTLVNGQPVMRHFLQSGDVIELAECRIVFDMAGGLPCADAAPPGNDKPLLDTPRLRILNGAHAGLSFDLVKPLTTVGRLGKQVAAILCLPDGVSLMHVEGAAHPLVNDQPAGVGMHRLQHLDTIDMSGTRLQFYSQPVSQ